MERERENVTLYNDCVCAFVYFFAFVCIVFVSRGKHTRETPAVVMPAACDVKLLRFPLVIIPLQASKLYLSSEFAETSLIF